MFLIAGVVGMRKERARCNTVSICISANGKRAEDRDSIAGMARRRGVSNCMAPAKICRFKKRDEQSDRA